MENYRKFLRSEQWDEWKKSETDQNKKIPRALPQKPYDKDAILIDLIGPDKITIGDMSLHDVIRRRKSHRKFTEEALTLEELSFLLWATQGVRKLSNSGLVTKRTVPSGGGTHPFETYLLINRVKGVEPGLYRYLPLDHKLCYEKTDPNMAEKISAACMEQSFIGKGAVVFVWTTIPYRSEWRYSFVAHKMIAIEAGHICQNLYSACTAAGIGACAIGAYRNDVMDDFIGVDGKNEMVIYLAPVGKIE